jgi:predicted outer membrane protein
MRDNKLEIDLSQLALRRSTNDEVMKLAQLMVTDHTEILNNLAKIAQSNSMLAIPGYPTDGDASGTASSSNKSTLAEAASSIKRSQGTSPGNSGNKDVGTINNGSYNNLGTTGTTRGASSSGRSGLKADNHNQKPVPANSNADRKTMQAIEAMQTATGPAFDKLWIPQMLRMHQAKLSELTAIVNTINDSDVRTAVKSAIPKIKKHIDMLSALNNSKLIK